MASKDAISDKENVRKENISGRTRSKSSKEPTPKRRKQLAALNNIRKFRETRKREPIRLQFEANIFEEITEEEFKKRKLEEKKSIEDDIGNGAYLKDGKEIVDDFQRGKGNEAHSERFTLKQLKGTQIYMCYGCDKPFREKPTAGRETLPAAPTDIVLKRKQFREYYDPENKELTVPNKTSFTYYHISWECISKKNSKISKVCISKHEWSDLRSSHKKLLNKEFGITKYTCEEDHD